MSVKEMFNSTSQNGEKLGVQKEKNRILGILLEEVKKREKEETQNAEIEINLLLKLSDKL